MTGQLLAVAPPALDQNASPYSGAVWRFYASGTSTPQAVYADADLETSLGSVVTADSDGRFPAIYFDSSKSYRGILRNSTGSDTILDIDPINTGSLADFASPAPGKGGSMVVTARSSLLTAGAARTIASKAEDRFDIRDMLGADLTGENDMASVLATALANSASTGDTLHIPFGPPGVGTILTLGSTVNVPGGARVQGDGNRAYYGGQAGAWLQFSHEDVGLNLTDAAYPFVDGVSFKNFGTRRIQPTPTTGFEPIDADFDIVNNGFDLLMEDFMFLNPTRAFRQPIGNAGRTTWKNVRGQPLLIGAQIDESYDGFIALNTRWWPFWSNDLYSRAYTLANRKGLVFGRCDNPSVQFWFDIFSKYPVVLASNAAGSINNGNFYGFEADNYGESFLYSEAGQTGGHATFVGGYSFGDSVSGHAVQLDGANTVIRMEAMRNHGCEKSVVKINGAGNLVQTASPKIGWNILNGGHVAYNPGAGTSRIRIDGDIVSEGGNGAAIVTDGVRVSSSARLASPLTLAPSSGSITTSAALIAYRRQDSRVTYDLTVTIANNGTGSGAGIALFGLPVAALTGSTFAAAGVDQGSGHKGITAVVDGSTIFLRNYDGTYPGYSGASFTISGAYEANPL